MPTGGSIKEISIGGRKFAVPADQDTQRKLGGAENEVQMNGDATARVVQTMVAWSIAGLAISADENRADHDFLQDLADGINADADGFYPVVITYASNHSRMGRGRPTGEIVFNSMNTTCTLSLGGPGKLELQ